MTDLNSMKAAEAARNKSYFDRIKVEKFEVKQ